MLSSGTTLSAIATYSLALVFEPGFTLSRCFHLYVAETVCEVYFEHPALPSAFSVYILTGEIACARPAHSLKYIAHRHFQVAFSFHHRFLYSCIHRPHCFTFESTLPY